jgi:hypothetical protein
LSSGGRVEDKTNLILFLEVWRNKWLRGSQTIICKLPGSRCSNIGGVDLAVRAQPWKNDLTGLSESLSCLTSIGCGFVNAFTPGQRKPSYIDCPRVFDRLLIESPTRSWLLTSNCPSSLLLSSLATKRRLAQSSAQIQTRTYQATTATNSRITPTNHQYVCRNRSPGAWLPSYVALPLLWSRV